MIYINQKQIRDIQASLNGINASINAIDGVKSTGDTMYGGLGILGDLTLLSGIHMSGEVYLMDINSTASGNIDVYGKLANSTPVEKTYVRLGNSGQEPVIALISGATGATINLNAGAMVRQGTKFELDTTGTLTVIHNGQTILNGDSAGFYSNKPVTFENVEHKLLQYQVLAGENILFDTFYSTNFFNRDYRLTLIRERDVQVRRLIISNVTGNLSIQGTGNCVTNEINIGTQVDINVTDVGGGIWQVWVDNNSSKKIRVFGLVKSSKK